MDNSDDSKFDTQPRKRVSPESFLRALPVSLATSGPDGQPEFQPVPLVIPERDRLALPEKPWRIILAFVEDPIQILPLELRGDVMFGASPVPEVDLDINLGFFKENLRGVSRHHIKLRPGRDKLFLLDMGSTNGTYVNGSLVSPASACALKDGDLITLGRLHLRVKIVQRPGGDG